MSLTDQLHNLHKNRVLLAEWQQVLAEKRFAVMAEFEAENAVLIYNIAKLLEEVNGLDAQVREFAIEQYEKDCNKQVCPGVTIAITKQYDYDPITAFGWAKEHRMCLSLDSKAFKDVCKADSTRPDFVTVREEPMARIASDLGELFAE